MKSSDEIAQSWQGFVLFISFFYFILSFVFKEHSLCTPGSLRVSDLINWLHVMLFQGCIPMHYVENTLPEDGAEGTITHKKETRVWGKCNHRHGNKDWNL